jgi:hypothetical protein
VKPIHAFYDSLNVYTNIIPSIHRIRPERCELQSPSTVASIPVITRAPGSVHRYEVRVDAGQGGTDSHIVPLRGGSLQRHAPYCCF